MFCGRPPGEPLSRRWSAAREPHVPTPPPSVETLEDLAFDVSAIGRRLDRKDPQDSGARPEEERRAPNRIDARTGAHDRSQTGPFTFQSRRLAGTRPVARSIAPVVAKSLSPDFVIPVPSLHHPEGSDKGLSRTNELFGQSG